MFVLCSPAPALESVICLESQFILLEIKCSKTKTWAQVIPLGDWNVNGSSPFNDQSKEIHVFIIITTYVYLNLHFCMYMSVK